MAGASSDAGPRRRSRIPGPWNRSLQARLVAYFLLLSLVSVTVVALAVYQRATLDLTRASFDRLQAVADVKADALDRWIEEQRRVVEFAAGAAGLGDAAATLLATESNPFARDVAEATLAGTLDSVLVRISDADAFMLLDLDGTVRFATDPDLVGSSQSAEPYVTRAHDGTVVQDVYTSVVTGEPTITVAAPVRDDDELVAILAADLDLIELDRIILEGTGLGEGGGVYMISPEGRFLHARLHARLGDDVVISSTAIDNVLARGSGEATYEDYRGVPVVGTYRWLPAHGAGLIVELSQDVAFASAQELLLLIVIIGFFTVVLLASGIWILARQVSRPLGELETAATAVAGGDLDVTAPVRSEDEVGRLTVAFNAMTAQLRENVQTLERRVDERTTELSEAMEALTSTEALFRGLVEQLPMAVYTDAPDGSPESRYVSPTIETLFGYPAERWSDHAFIDGIIHPDDLERARAETSLERLREEERISSTFRIRAADGRTLWVQDDRWLVRDADGEIVQVQGIFADVTQRMIDEAELNRQKTFYEGLLEASPVAIATIVGESEMVVSWNPQAERLFGWTADEAIGRLINDLLVQDDELQAEAATLQPAATAEGLASAITRRTRKDGSLVDVEILVVPLRIDGEHVASIAIYHDISELQAARAEADAANAAKSSFLAAMSHEIRTPMNAIIGMSGLLVDTELGDEQRDFVETIRTSSEALLLIINDILDFSKIEAGRIELESKPFSLRDCLEGAVDVLAPAAAEKRIELAYDIDDALPPMLRGDAGRVRQVVLNLLSNAVKFTPAGEVELRARGQAPDDADGAWRLEVTVRDTGIGISEEQMGRLFQSFSQADTSIARRFGGTGLGLAISRRLAEAMHGSLTAESTGVEGEGATFTFTARLPAATDVPAPRAPVERTDLSGRTVLIVDDNATNRRILSAQVERWGMTPRDTASAKEALEWIDEGATFDIVLTDLNMPELDGLRLAAAVRTSRPGVPVVVLSSMGYRDRGEAPVEAYLTKPVKPSALHDTIQTVLAGTPADPSSRATRELSLDPGMAAAHPLSILLAEDNLVNQKLALKLLERMGYEATVVGDGAAAVRAVDEGAFDVVLMDIQMPELDGLEATRRIRAAHGTDGPHIIAMTANAMAEDREASLSAGMDDYLSKPIRVDALVEALWAAPSPDSPSPEAEAPPASSGAET